MACHGSDLLLTSLMPAVWLRRKGRRRGSKGSILDTSSALELLRVISCMSKKVFINIDLDIMTI